MLTLKAENARGVLLRLAIALVIPTFSYTLMVVQKGTAFASPESKAAFCGRSIEPDYESVFADLPSVKEIPASGELPFGPGRLRVRSPDEAVLVPPVRVGYDFFLESPYRAQGVRPHWVLTLIAKRIGRTGVLGAVVASAEHRLDTLGRSSSQSIALNLPSKPGLYLLDLRFRRHMGRMLGRYGQYVRVMRPRTDARLSVSASSFKAGDEVLFRVENRGTTPVGLIGEEFRFERYSDGVWSEDPASPNAFTRQRLGQLPAGTAGFCRAFSMPSSIDPGHYRISKRVTISPKVGFKSLQAEFDIAG